MRAQYLIVAAVAALAAMAVTAYAAQVYVEEGETGRVWGYADTVATVLCDPDSFPGIAGLAIANDGQILVADFVRGIAKLDPGTGVITVIDSLAFPSDVHPDYESNDIYYVDGSRTSHLWVLIGGAAPAQQCYTLPQAWDLQVYPIGERAGHVLLLVGSADTLGPRLIELERTGPTSFTECPPLLVDIPGDPVAFAIRPGGGIVLLDVIGGMYAVGEGGELTQFGPVPEPANHWVDVDIGADGTIYVTDYEFNTTYRFDPDGNPTLPDLGSGIQHPSQIAAAGFTPSPPGSNVPVTPIPGVDMVFEQIPGGGYTTAIVTESDSPVSPKGHPLPTYAAAPVGQEDFDYISLVTTAVYENVIQVDVFLPGERLFSAQGEDSVFHDVTVEGSIEDARGVISRFDEIVLVQDLRPTVDAVDDKFSRLFEILEILPGDPPALSAAKAQLEGRAEDAEGLYAADSLGAASDELLLMNTEIRGYAGDEIPNSSDDPMGNLAGEMLSRSKTLIFSLSLLDPPTGVPTPESGAAENSVSLACASPARGECRFELSGPAGARATVRLYDVGGRLVRTLFDGLLTAGSQTLVWDGTDDDGRDVASGVYLTRAGSGNSLASRKVVFIR